MMTRRLNPFFLVVPILVLVATLNLSSCGDDDEGATGTNNKPTVPKVTAAMQGIWTYEVIARDCATDEIVPELSDSGTDTLCAGDPIAEEGGDEILGNCSVEILSGNSFRVSCSQTETIDDCTLQMTLQSEYAYSDTTVTGTATLAFTFSGTGCEGLTPECYEFTLTVNRDESAPEGACPAPAAPRAVASRLGGKLLKNR